LVDLLYQAAIIQSGYSRIFASITKGLNWDWSSPVALISQTLCGAIKKGSSFAKCSEEDY